MSVESPLGAHIPEGGIQSRVRLRGTTTTRRFGGTDMGLGLHIQCGCFNRCFHRMTRIKERVARSNAWLCPVSVHKLIFDLTAGF